MKLKFIALLPLIYYCPALFAEQVVTASYKDVCERMDQRGISSRTQSDSNSRQLVDNAVVVVGARHLSRPRQAQLVANSDIVLGTSMAQINIAESGPNGASGPAARSADPCR